MPLEIRELVIRAVVGGSDPAPQQDDAHLPATGPLPAGQSFDELVQECVRQVMQALARERER